LKGRWPPSSARRGRSKRSRAGPSPAAGASRNPPERPLLPAGLKPPPLKPPARAGRSPSLPDGRPRPSPEPGRPPSKPPERPPGPPERPPPPGLRGPRGPRLLSSSLMIGSLCRPFW
jgi:hypothetical protein